MFSFFKAKSKTDNVVFVQNNTLQQQQMTFAKPSERGKDKITEPFVLSAPPTVDVPVDRDIDSKRSLVAMVIDRSGSMSTMGCEVEGGCNAYLDEQRATDESDGIETSVFFSTFDSKIETIHNGINLASVPAITRKDVEPRGCTALYDGIGDTLLRVAESLRNQDTMPGKVVIFILTDGHENSSRIWDSESITAEIKRLSEAPYNFDFYFAAANQDALDKGAQMGIPQAQCLDYDATPDGMKQAMTSASAAYTRGKRGQSKGFSTKERSQASSKYA